MMAADAAQTMAGEPCVLFVGSGISTPSPSNLPSAYGAVSVFLRRVAQGIVPLGLMDELLDRRGVLPEYVYGLAERHFGPRVYDVWTALELWRTVPNTFAPNAGHISTVHAASKSRTPVLTPNFDTYLEEAAERLGIQPRVSVARPGQAFEPVVAGTGQVAIWKLHGTALEPGTVFSSVRTLTMPVRGLREQLRAAVPVSTRLILAGYSGRDLDLFPVLAGGRSRKRPIWVDLSFGSEHRARLLNPAADEVVAPFDEVAQLYAALCDDRLRATVEGSERLAHSAGHASSAATLEADIAARFDAVAAELTDEAGRRLVLAELLINGGLAGAAVGVLNNGTYVGPSKSEQVRLLAKAQWELGKFRTSETLAREGLRGATQAGERNALRFAVTAARMRAAVPPAGLPGTAPAPHRLIVANAFSAGFNYLRAAPRAMCPSRTPEPTRTPLVEGWIEHGIRLLLALQVFISGPEGSVPRPFDRLFILLWTLLRRQALRAGYAEGIGNSGRYLARLHIHDPDGIRAAHEFLGHFLGVGIAHRDAAAQAIRQGDLELARREFYRGLDVARMQGDPVLMLTFVPLAEKLGATLTLDKKLIAGIEADWAVDYVAWLDTQDEPESGGAE